MKRWVIIIILLTIPFVCFTAIRINNFRESIQFEDTGEKANMPSISLVIKSTSIPVPSGESITVNWKSNRATRVKASNFGASTLSGSKTVQQFGTTTYWIVVIGDDGCEHRKEMTIHSE